MVVNFRALEISRSICKLTRIPTLIKKKDIKEKKKKIVCIYLNERSIQRALFIHKNSHPIWKAISKKI
jgi:hypothetical protein